MPSKPSMKVSDIMSKDLVSCHENDSAQQAARMMCDNDIGSLPVVDSDNRLLGVVTDRDICCRIIARGMPSDTSIREAMTRDMHTVHPDADLRELESTMKKFKVRRVPVVDDEGKLQGYVAQADLLLHLKEAPRQEHEVVVVLEEISVPW